MSEIQEEKHAIDTWRPRHITKDYLNNVATNVSNDKLIPEVVLIAFLELWKKRNYGHMANLYWLPLSNHKPDIMGVKQQFRDKTIGAYRVTNIVDDAPAITNIGVEIIIDSVPSSFEARLLFAGSNDNKPNCRNSCDGEWKLVHVRQQ